MQILSADRFWCLVCAAFVHHTLAAEQRHFPCPSHLLPPNHLGQIRLIIKHKAVCHLGTAQPWSKSTSLKGIDTSVGFIRGEGVPPKPPTLGGEKNWIPGGTAEPMLKFWNASLRDHDVS